MSDDADACLIGVQQMLCFRSSAAYGRLLTRSLPAGGVCRQVTVRFFLDYNDGCLGVSYLVLSFLQSLGHWRIYYVTSMSPGK